MEIDCGRWEMRRWDELPGEEVDPWMKDFVQMRIPGGENYIDLYQRVTRCYDRIRVGTPDKDVPDRPGSTQSPDGANSLTGRSPSSPMQARFSILAFLTVERPSSTSLCPFPSHYGCVVRIGADGILPYEILSNPVPPEKEQQ